MSSLLITGAAGFIGRNLLRAVDPDRYRPVYCLTRACNTMALPFPNAKPLVSTLREIDQHERELAGVETVVHAAAATGKASPQEFFESNVEGTERLVRLSRRLGVSRFLYLSSIAVRFPDKRRYYYAQSKERAEEVVRESGLRFTIVRPTMVLGRGSPVYAGLAKLAQLPVVPIFGNGRVLVQPVHVDDLVDFLLALMESDAFEGETLEFGGPETLTTEDLLLRIGRLHRGSNARKVHIPFSLVLPILGMVERFALSAVPVTAGQLSSFRYEGTIQENRFYRERRPQLKTVDQMLAASMTK